MGLRPIPYVDNPEDILDLANSFRPFHELDGFVGMSFCSFDLSTYIDTRTAAVNN